MNIIYQKPIKVDGTDAIRILIDNAGNYTEIWLPGLEMPFVALGKHGVALSLFPIDSQTMMLIAERTKAG